MENEKKDEILENKDLQENKSDDGILSTLLNWALIIAFVFFAYKYISENGGISGAISSFFEKEYDCERVVARDGALDLYFNGYSHNPEIFIDEFMPRLKRVATVSHSLLKLDKSTKSSKCTLNMDFDLSAGNLVEARDKYDSLMYIFENSKNDMVRFLLLTSFDLKRDQNFDGRFSSLEEYQNYVEKQKDRERNMGLFGGDISKFYYKVADNGNGEVYVQVAGKLQDLD